MKEKFQTALVTNKRAIKEGKSVHTCNEPNNICVGTQCMHAHSKRCLFSETKSLNKPWNGWLKI